MPSDSAAPPRLLAVSDLHVGYPENRAIVEGLRPGSAGDGLIVAGDVGELVADIERATPEDPYPVWTGPGGPVNIPDQPGIPRQILPVPDVPAPVAAGVFR